MTVYQVMISYSYICNLHQQTQPSDVHCVHFPRLALLTMKQETQYEFFLRNYSNANVFIC